MLWMETYLFYCSVRLGVIIVASLSLIQLVIPSILLFVFGIESLNPIIDLFQNDEEYKKSTFVLKSIDWIENHPEYVIIAAQTYFLVHSLSCMAGIYGALKLNKWFLLPISFFEFIRVIYYLATHIVLMIILKKILPLGTLIILTLVGGFLILYFGYNWAACVAFYQILQLINTQRYKLLYGVDPMHPTTPNHQFAYGTVENVRVLVTPNESEIDVQKHKFRALISKNSKVKSTTPAIIEVRPFYDAYDHTEMNKQKSHRWWLHNDGYQQTANVRNNIYNDPDEAYNYWQWSELVTHKNRRNKF